MKLFENIARAKYGKKNTRTASCPSLVYNNTNTNVFRSVTKTFYCIYLMANTILYH